MAEIYKQFSQIKRVENFSESFIKIWDEYDSFRDFSEEALIEAYNKETYGIACDIIRSNGKINGYIEGKQWMDLTITEYWLPDRQSGELFLADLYDGELPEWFIEKICRNKIPLTKKKKCD